MIKDQINKDLKQAMLDGNKELVSALRNIKSVIGYSEVAQNKRDEGLSDKELLTLLGKESKKRLEAAELYKKAGDKQRTDAELFEKGIIDKYLPEAMNENEISELVDRAEKELGEITQKTMGRAISLVRELSDNRAEGGVVARLVSQKIKK
jgi:uncharacterized protein